MRATVFAVAFLLSFPGVAEEEGASLSLKVGQSLQLSGEDVERIAVEDPSVIAVEPGKERVTVLALRPGTTRLLVWRAGETEARTVTVSPAAEAQPAAPDERISLKVGSSRVLIVPGLRRVSVGEPSVADISSVEKDQILLEAKSAGTTTLLHWDGEGKRKAIEVTVR